jgi:hypothetical protein
VSGLERGSFEAKGFRDEMFEVGVDLGRGCSWSRDMLLFAPIDWVRAETALHGFVWFVP